MPHEPPDVARGGHEPRYFGTQSATADRLAATSVARRIRLPPWPPTATPARRTPLQVANTVEAANVAPDPAAEGPDPVI